MPATITTTIDDAAARIEKTIHFNGELIATIIEKPVFHYEVNTELCHSVHSGIFHQYYFDNGITLTVFHNGARGTFDLTGEDENENIPTEYRYTDQGS